MLPASAKEKGKLLENFIADKLVSLGIDKTAIRQIGSGSGKRKGDIQTTIPWTIEAKNQKAFNWKEAAKQVKREAMGYNKEVIIWHPPGVSLDDSIAIINVNEFFDILLQQKRHAESNEILDSYQIKSNLDKAVFYLKQVIKNLN